MKNNTFLMLALLLSGNLLLSEGIAKEALNTLTGGEMGDKHTEVTNTGEGDSTVEEMSAAAGGVAVKVDTIIAINNCSGNANCTNNVKSKNKKGANAVGDVISTIGIENARSLIGNLRNARIEMPRDGQTIVYSFVLSAGADKGSTVYLALTGSKIDRTLNEASKNAPKNHDTYVVLSINVDGEKELDKDTYRFIETGSFSFNSRQLKALKKPGIRVSIEADGTAKIAGIDVPLNFNRNIIVVK